MQYAADYGVSLMLLLSVGFLPSGFISYLIRERKQEEKQVQLTSGVSKMNNMLFQFTVFINIISLIAFERLFSLMDIL